MSLREASTLNAHSSFRSLPDNGGRLTKERERERDFNAPVDEQHSGDSNDVFIT